MLRDFIAALQQRGYAILYSDSVVLSSQRVQVEAVSFRALQQALPDLGLQLQQHEAGWLIVRAEVLSSSEPSGEPAAAPEPVLETVIVTGSLHRLPHLAAGASGYALNTQEMSLVPSLGSDVLRATLRLPGVSSVGVSAKPQIRGGLDDELLVIQDGVELLEPFHLADYHSAYSSFDYHTIESMDLYTGGFPSRYGNRMSGVMDIQNQWQGEQYNTDIGISSFSNFLHTRGELGREKPASWLFSVRQGDLTDLTDYIETRAGEPTYADVSARMNVEMSTHVAINVGAVYSEDDVVFNDAEETASSRIKSSYLWGALDWQSSGLMRGRITVSWLDFERRKKLSSVAEEDEEEDEAKGGLLDHSQKVRRLAVRNDWTALRDQTLFEFGWQLEYSRADYEHLSRIDRGELADILGTQREVNSAIVREPEGFSGGAYVQAEWEIGRGLSIQPSLRLDAQEYYLESGARYQVSPRLGMTWDIDDQTRTRFSLGRFHQPEGIQELQANDGIAEFYAPQYSDQVVLGIDWQRAQLTLVAEFYYKRYGDLKGRFENMFNPFVLLPEMEPDRAQLEPDRAIAQGVDLDFGWQPVETLGGHFRYSYMDAQDRIEGIWIDRRWSQTHTVNTGLLWRRGSFSLSLAMTWHSGWRSSELPAFVADGEMVSVPSVLNNTELRDYFSLDIGLRNYWEIGRTQLQIYATISNVTDRANEAGIDFDLEEVEGGYELIPDRETLLGRVPSVGIVLSF